MPTRNLPYAVPLALAAAVAASLFAGRSHAEASITVQALARETHFHGVAVGAAEISQLYLATHHGLYGVAPDGTAKRLSPVQDFMGFTPHPTDPSTLYASGHPAGGGNLGFIVSEDGGGSWTQLAEGVGGPVDFHQMDVSPADPKTIYGAYAGQLQVSSDGGESWQVVGPAPEGLIDLAASSADPSILYAGTQAGLLKSADGGRSWQDAYLLRRPTSMVHVTREGVVLAFVVGSGLIRATEPTLSWQPLGADFGEDYVVHLAADPSDPDKLYAVTLNPRSHAQAVLASADGGKSWAALGAG